MSYRRFDKDSYFSLMERNKIIVEEASKIFKDIEIFPQENGGLTFYTKSDNFNYFEIIKPDYFSYSQKSYILICYRLKYIFENREYFIDLIDSSINSGNRKQIYKF